MVEQNELKEEDSNLYRHSMFQSEHKDKNTLNFKNIFFFCFSFHLHFISPKQVCYLGLVFWMHSSQTLFGGQLCPREHKYGMTESTLWGAFKSEICFRKFHLLASNNTG